jgi:hypothetical protein
MLPSEIIPRHQDRLHNDVALELHNQSPAPRHSLRPSRKAALVNSQWREPLEQMAFQSQSPNGATEILRTNQSMDFGRALCYGRPCWINPVFRSLKTEEKRTSFRPSIGESCAQQ